MPRGRASRIPVLLDASWSALRLLTNTAFEANVSLYKRFGYVVDREEPFMNGVTVYMSKKLTRDFDKEAGE